MSLEQGVGSLAWISGFYWKNASVAHDEKRVQMFRVVSQAKQIWLFLLDFPSIKNGLEWGAGLR